MIFNKYVRRKKQLKSKYKTFKSNYKKPTQCRSHQASLGLCNIQFTKIFKKADVYFEFFLLTSYSISFNVSGFLLSFNKSFLIV